MISRGPLRSVSRPGEARRVTRSQSLDTDRASATLWLFGKCHFGIATLQTKTETLTNLIRVRGLWFYLVRHWILLNRGGMGYVAAEFLPERRCIIRVNLSVIASTRDRDIGRAAIEQILSAQLGVYVNQDTVGSLPLAGVARHCIAVVEMRAPTEKFRISLRKTETPQSGLIRALKGAEENGRAIFISFSAGGRASDGCQESDGTREHSHELNHAQRGNDTQRNKPVRFILLLR
jgi:hypothetical protein